MNFETVELIKKDKVATIKLNRPDKLNAFNEKLIWELQEATSEVKDDEDIKVLIITGAGRGFSAGADLTESESSWEGSKDALLRGFKPFFENIITMPKPVIASIAGPAAGIGAADGRSSGQSPEFDACGRTVSQKLQRPRQAERHRLHP